MLVDIVLNYHLAVVIYDIGIKVGGKDFHE